jgi:hypothetical protein
MRTDAFICSFVAALTVVGVASAAEPDLGPSAVPPAHVETLIPAPAFIFNSSTASDENSLMRPNAGVQSPGMNVYHSSPTDHRPPVYSEERLRAILTTGLYDIDAAESYGNVEPRLSDGDAWQRRYDWRSERLHQIADTYAFEPNGSPPPPAYAPPQSYYGYAPGPYYYAGYYGPACVPSFGLGVGGRGRVHSAVGISCW